MHFEKEVGESLTYKFAQTANQMKAQGKEIISLGLGEPDFATPRYVVDATIEAMNQGHTHYSASQGLPELRGLIAQEASERYHSNYQASEVIITPGIKAAAYFALCSVLEPMDEVILLSPYYVSYPAMVKLAEPTAKIKNVCLRKDFSLDIDALRNAMSSKTKCILLNTPHNPTGMVLSDLEVKEIVDLAVEHDVYVISDEVYEHLVYSGARHNSFGQYPQLKERLIIANGYSKSYAMTGWRLGYAIGPGHIIAKMNRLQQHINTNTCTFIQKGACAIYQNQECHLKPYIQELEKRMKFFHEEIRKIEYMDGVMPCAGFFYFADISKTGMDSNTFCSELLKKTGIASTPGIAFGPEWDNHVRFSVAVPMEVLERAINLMRSFEPR